jgi:protocatechuate 3,4-dioxygenase beta subunit
MRLRGLVVIATVCAAAWTSGAAQSRDGVQGQGPTKPATGAMMGRVTLAGSGQPFEGVRVTLNGAALRGTRSVLTDAEGQFLFTELPAGTYTVRGTMTGYVAGTYGQKAPGKQGTPIVLVDGQQLKNVSFEIGKGGVISGTVVDERNRPSINTPVRAMRWLMQSGERVLTVAGTANTDDRGIYRIHSLTPGDYLVSAVPRNTSIEIVTSADMAAQVRMQELAQLGLSQPGAVMDISSSGGLPAGTSDPVEGYAPVFFPGTAQVTSAQTIKVGVAVEQLGIDFGLQRVGLVTVSGSVITPPGVNPTTVQLRLVQPEGSAMGVGQMSARPNQNGTFTFRTVTPGQYVLIASATITPPRPTPLTPGVTNFGPAQNAQQRLWAQADLYVDGRQPLTVGLTMQEGVQVLGQLTFDGALPLPAKMESVRVMLNPLGQPLQSMGLGNWTANSDATGRFTLHGVVPGRYRFGASGAQGWQIKSVLANGVDVLDFPFIVDPGAQVPGVTIQFGDKSTELKGTLTGPDGSPTADYSVVVFPDDQRYWIPHARRMRSTRPATDGTFSITGLPPGDYRIAAVTDIETGEWLDPDFLRELLPASISFRLAEGQPATQDIRVR